MTLYDLIHQWYHVCCIGMFCYVHVNIVMDALPNVERLIQFCWILCLIHCLPYLWRRRTANKNIHPITGTKLFHGPACYPFAANFCKKFMVSLSCVYIQHFVISKFLAIKLVVYWEIHTFLNNIKTFKKR